MPANVVKEYKQQGYLKNRTNSQVKKETRFKNKIEVKSKKMSRQPSAEEKFSLITPDQITGSYDISVENVFVPKKKETRSK